jgi:hypothetical protein
MCEVADQATGWTTRVQFSAGTIMGVFLFATAPRPALGPTTLLSNGYWGQRGRCVMLITPPSSAEDMNAWSYTSTPP